MGGQKQKPIQTPFEQKNTYAPVSIANTPEAKALLDVPIDVDPGVGRRTDLAEQEVDNRYNSAFMMGVPGYLRERMQESEKRAVRSQGAGEAQAAEAEKNRLELERRRLLLPQIVGTGQSGYNSQLTQPTQGAFSSFLGGLGSGIGGALSGPLGKI